MCCRKPFSEDGEKPRNKAPKTQHLADSTCPAAQIPTYRLKKQHTHRNKEEAAEPARLLLKRMEEAKEITRNRLLRDVVLRQQLRVLRHTNLETCPDICRPYCLA